MEEQLDCDTGTMSPWSCRSLQSILSLSPSQGPPTEDGGPHSTQQLSLSLRPSCQVRIGWDLDWLSLPFPLLSSSSLYSFPSPPLPYSLQLLSGLLPSISLSPCTFYFPLSLGQAWVMLGSFHPLLCLTPPDPMLAPLGWVLRPWLPQGSSSCRLQGGAGGVC